METERGGPVFTSVQQVWGGRTCVKVQTGAGEGASRPERTPGLGGGGGGGGSSFPV